MRDDQPSTAPGIPPQGPTTIDDPLLCPSPRNPQYGSWTTGAAPSAEVNFSGGCIVLGGGTTLSGTINITGATVLAGAIQGPDAVVYATSGTLAFEDPAIASTLATLYVSSTLTGPGEIDVCTNITWQAGRMTGTGSTVICPGATGQFNPPGSPCLAHDHRALVNRGTLTWTSGCVAGGPGGRIVNYGDINANSTSAAGMSLAVTDEPSLPTLINRGRLGRDVPGTAIISYPAINTGTVQPTIGNIQFNDNGADRTDDVLDGPEVTPEGRELTVHASQRRQERDLDLFQIDEIIDNNSPQPTASGNDQYYDAGENLSVLTEPGGQVVVTVFIGP